MTTVDDGAAPPSRLAWLALVGVAVALLAALPATLGGPTSASSPEGVRPVPGEVVAGFDPPDRPYGPGRRGVQLAADAGEPVRAVRGGRVVFAGPVAGTPWVSVDHGGGLRTSYGPVEPQVRVGETVSAGGVLGHVAGSAQGELHWGARLDGRYIDPLDLLRAWRPVLVPREEQPE